MAKTKVADQHKVFVEAARELGADVPEVEFDRALRRVASAPPAPMHKPKKRTKRKPKKPGR